MSNSLPNLISFPEERQLAGISNWAVFRDHLKSVARATGLTGYLDGTIVAPTTPTAPTTTTVHTTTSDGAPALVEYDMMVESALPSSANTTAPNALAVPSRSSSGGVVCDNCKRVGHTKKNCWAKGGGSEGKAPRWYNAPKGMEPSPKPVTAASIQEEERQFAAAATVYDFSDYDFGGMDKLSCCPTAPDAHSHRLGEQEAFALLSDEQGNTSSIAPSSVASSSPPNSIIDVPTFIDSGASHWCIRNRRRFVTYTPVKSVGQMAAEGSSGSFAIEGHGIAEITFCDESPLPTQHGQKGFERRVGQWTN
ncbi:hypothetical protein C8R42DRAFT_637576 [Lentinula raphanica]|nr:hypothetical protein C8R42DRAFT_637576 [Lentinula raphanica]